MIKFKKLCAYVLMVAVLLSITVSGSILHISAEDEDDYEDEEIINSSEPNNVSEPNATISEDAGKSNGESVEPNSANNDGTITKNNTSEYDGIAKILTALKILEGYEEGTFSPDELTSRGQLAVLVTGMLGLQEAAKSERETQMFTDVFSDNKAAGSIHILSKRGIMPGDKDGSFKPDDQVTYEQVIKVLVTALGYAPYAKEKGGDPMGYMVVAGDTGITKKVGGDLKEPITNENTTRLIFNALEVEVMKPSVFGKNPSFDLENGKTVLTEYLKVTKKTEQITATSYTSFSGDSSIEKDEVLIGDVIYKVGSTKAQEYLGYKVTFYAKEETDTNVKTLVFVTPDDKNDVISVESDQIADGASQYQFLYWKDKDKDSQPKKAKISKRAYTIYNNKATGLLPQYLKPSCGQVVLVDTNKDSEYDVVLITSYKTVIVEEVDVFENKVYDKYNSTDVTELDPDNINNELYLEKDGEEATINDIQEWDVLQVAASVNKGKKYTRAVVVRNPIEGKPAEIDNDKVVINEKEYELSDGFKIIRDQNANSTTKDANKEIKVDVFGKFYLDIQGKIAAYQSNVGAYRNYAFLAKGSIDSGIGKKVKLKLLETGGKWNNLELANSIKLDDQVVTSKSFKDVEKMSALYTINGQGKVEFKRQLIVFELDSEGKIKLIDTAETITSSNADELLRNNSFSKREVTKSEYYSPSKTFNGEQYITASTKVFIIPKAGSSVANDDQYYQVRDYQYFTNDKEYDELELFDLSRFSTARAVVDYMATPYEAVNEKEYLFMVKRVAKVINKDGDETYKLTGYVNNKEVSYETVNLNIIDGSNTPQIREGDILQVDLDDKSRIDSFVKHVDVSLGRSGIFYTDSYYAYCTLMYGIITGMDTVDKKLEMYSKTKAATPVEVVKIFDYGQKDTLCYVYEEKGKDHKILLGNRADMRVGDTVLLRLKSDRLLEVVIYRFNKK